jgi:hypothetical protein
MLPLTQRLCLTIGRPRAHLSSTTLCNVRAPAAVAAAGVEQAAVMMRRCRRGSSVRENCPSLSRHAQDSNGLMMDVL